MRVLVFIYNHQVCYIRWNGFDSNHFRVKNGVHQGAILSPTLFCIYLDTIFFELRSAGLGCHIGGCFLGAFGYADDVTLLVPSRQSLQIMLKICEDYANSHSMLFSTDKDPNKSKTKCMFFSCDRSQDNVMPVILNGNKLPWANSAKHLGNYLSTKISYNTKSPDMKSDLLCKRGMLFDSVHKIQQQFGYCHPDLVMKLIGIYSTSLYGSPLWEYYSPEYMKLTRSWNIVTKMVWNLPFATHTRFLESLSPMPHIGSALEGRYLGFLEGLTKTNKPFLSLLFNSCKLDMCSVTGRNIDILMSNHEKRNLCSLLQARHDLGRRRRYSIAEGEKWKTDMIRELALVIIALDFMEEDAQTILEFICTS